MSRFLSAFCYSQSQVRIDRRRGVEKEAMAIFFILLLSAAVHSNAEEGEAFDVRQHLCTATRYDVGKNLADHTHVPSNKPDQCTPIHLNLVARHGTRAPTQDRLEELNNLAEHIGILLQEAKEQKLALQKLPSWFWGWESPWKKKTKAGELLIEGEDEVYHLGIRIRDKFPQLFKGEYHQDMFAIKASQVHRASASAVAFGIALFGERGHLGLGHNRAFSVHSESRANDIWLRFHDCCQSYKAYIESQKPAILKLQAPTLNKIAAAISDRYKLNFTRDDTSSLWFLCKQEASLLNITDQACALFTPSEVALLEWTDDLELFILKGYGNELNYRMGVPLLKDVIESMEDAIKARQEAEEPGSYEKARLRFAHAETLLPFTCLLGLFREGYEFKKILREQPLKLPPKPPQRRNWSGSKVSPFAGNSMVVLYNCEVESSSKYFVQVLHNEHPMPLPGCGNFDFCPYEVFKEKIVAPHLEYDYNTICEVKSEQPEQLSFAA